MRLRIVLLVPTLLVGLLVALAPSPATAGPTRAELLQRANRIEFTVSLPKFMSIYRQPKTGIDRHFNWANYDGCSLPRAIKPIASRWDKLFTRACLRHDFGYRNYGNGLALGANETYKSAIDKEFRSNMLWTCDHSNVSSADLDNCYAAAGLFYLGVSRFGKAQTAFYKGKCTKGRFCLFDDHGYADRRIALAKSEDDMNDIDFGDKTSSVINRTGVAWIVYDDHDFEDRAFCIPPGVSVRDFGIDALKFNDKTSSAKRRTVAKCPKGIAQIN